jgi:hypothetical protein
VRAIRIIANLGDLDTVTEDAGGTYHVAGTPPVFAAGTNTVVVSIGEDKASTTVTDSQEVNPDATTTTVTSSVNPSGSGQPVTFTATVMATAPGSGTPTGTVTFKDGSKTLGTGTAAGLGQWTLTTSTLALGPHSITAGFGGSSSYTGSTSAVLTQTVNGGALVLTGPASNSPSYNAGLLAVSVLQATPLAGTGSPTPKHTVTVATPPTTNFQSTVSLSPAASTGQSAADVGTGGNRSRVTSLDRFFAAFGKDWRIGDDNGAT